MPTCAHHATPSNPPLLPSSRHLPGQIVQTGQAVDDLMATDFLERGRFAAEAVAQGGILDRLRLQVKQRTNASASFWLWCVLTG